MTFFTDANVEFTGVVRPGDARAIDGAEACSSAGASSASRCEMTLEDGTRRLLRARSPAWGCRDEAARRRDRPRRRRAERRTASPTFEARAARGPLGHARERGDGRARLRAARSPACRRASTSSPRSSFDDELLLAMNSSHRYAALAALEAWQDAGPRAPGARRRRASTGTPAPSSAPASAAWTRSREAWCRSSTRRRCGGSAARPSSR